MLRRSRYEKRTEQGTGNRENAVFPKCSGTCFGTTPGKPIPVCYLAFVKKSENLKTSKSAGVFRIFKKSN